MIVVILEMNILITVMLDSYNSSSSNNNGND